MRKRLTSMRITDDQLAAIIRLAERLGVRYSTKQPSGLGAIVRALASAYSATPELVEALLRPHAHMPGESVKDS